MKPSAALAWTKRQRSQLAGLRVRHKNDPPPRDRPAEGWARIRGWIESTAALQDKTGDPALRADIASVRDEVSPPGRYEVTREELRVTIADVGLACRKKWYYNEPFFAESFADFWASLDFMGALTHPSSAPIFVGTHGELGVEEVRPREPGWISHPWQLGGRGLNVGYAYFSALRRRVFDMPEDAYKQAFAAASELRSRVLDSDVNDRMTMLFVLAFVFARDGHWAREHAEAILETPKLGTFIGRDLLVPSLTDPHLALALMRQDSSWVDRYSYNLPLLFDIVESLGSDAAPVLQAIYTGSFKPRITKLIGDAIALANS